MVRIGVWHAGHSTCIQAGFLSLRNLGLICPGLFPIPISDVESFGFHKCLCNNSQTCSLFFSMEKQAENHCDSRENLIEFCGHELS